MHCNQCLFAITLTFSLHAGSTPSQRSFRELQGRASFVPDGIPGSQYRKIIADTSGFTTLQASFPEPSPVGEAHTITSGPRQNLAAGAKRVREQSAFASTSLAWNIFQRMWTSRSNDVILSTSNLYGITSFRSGPRRASVPISGISRKQSVSCYKFHCHLLSPRNNPNQIRRPQSDILFFK